jgi:hypothetical protein
MLATAGEPQIDATRVVGIARAQNPTFSLEAAAEFHGSVVTNLQALGEDADSDFRRGRHAFDREQCLMLLRFRAGDARRVLAEIQETADFVAEIRQSREVDLV